MRNCRELCPQQDKKVYLSWWICSNAFTNNDSGRSISNERFFKRLRTPTGRWQPAGCCQRLEEHICLLQSIWTWRNSTQSRRCKSWTTCPQKLFYIIVSSSEQVTSLIILVMRLVTLKGKLKLYSCMRQRRWCPNSYRAVLIRPRVKWFFAIITVSLL